MNTSFKTKKCQFCCELIHHEADVCKHCHRNQINETKMSEMIMELSLIKNVIGFIIFIIVAFAIAWWVGIIAIILIILKVNTKQKHLKKISKIKLLEEYEKYKNREKIINIISYLILGIVIVLVVFYFIGASM